MWSIFLAKCNRINRLEKFIRDIPTLNDCPKNFSSNEMPEAFATSDMLQLNSPEKSWPLFLTSSGHTGIFIESETFKIRRSRVRARGTYYYEPGGWGRQVSNVNLFGSVPNFYNFATLGYHSLLLIILFSWLWYPRHSFVENDTAIAIKATASYYMGRIYLMHLNSRCLKSQLFSGKISPSFLSS